MLNPPLDLGQTITQCQRGNPLAWEALVKQHQARVYGLSCFYLRNRVDAQEAVQDIFIKVFHGLQSFKGGGEEFLPWLLAIARNCCLDRLRAVRVRNHYEDAYETMQVRIGNAVESPETIAARDQQQRMLYQALSEIDGTSRDILVLKDIQGLKLEQVAEILAIPVGTVKSRSNRTRIDLVKRLTQLHDELPDSKLPDSELPDSELPDSKESY